MWAGALWIIPANRRRGPFPYVPYADGIVTPISSIPTEKSLVAKTASRKGTHTNGGKKKMNKTGKLMVAFTIGQIVQVVMHILARVWYMNSPVVFCVCSGFLLTVCVVIGITLAGSDKPKHGKTHSEWAEPGVDLHE